jgi:hypothetical protein
MLGGSGVLGINASGAAVMKALMTVHLTGESNTYCDSTTIRATPVTEPIVLRIHFSSDDLGRTRVASGPDVLWEIVNSVQLLQNNEGRMVFEGWHRRAKTLLAAAPLVETMRTLAVLCPHANYFPDFLTPIPAGTGPEPVIDTAIETVMATRVDGCARRCRNWVRAVDCRAGPASSPRETRRCYAVLAVRYATTIAR